jgi:hypothetical protein
MWWWKKKRKIPKEKDKWDISAKEAVEKYGTPTKAMEALFQDIPIVGSSPPIQLIYMYLREQYYRKNPR